MKIIAEVGINHNGSLEIARGCIDVAKMAGADVVKFQKRDLEIVYSHCWDDPRKSPWGDTQGAQKNQLELSQSDFDEIDRHCAEVNMDWTASAWDIKSLEFLDRYDLKSLKVASPMVASMEFLQAVAERRKEVYLSTGACDLSMVDDAVEVFTKAGCPFVLMHCVLAYPMPPALANLTVLDLYRKRYGCRVGWSGHERGLDISFAAAGFGIHAIERHLTLSKLLYGSDQEASLDPQEFTDLCHGLRRIESAMGRPIKAILPEEEKNAWKLRAHLNCDNLPEQQ